jgi:hypothetical protein
MNNSINLGLFVTLGLFVMSVLSINGMPNVSTSHASSIEPEKNSTFSNSSVSDFESNPVTTIIIPNEESNFASFNGTIIGSVGNPTNLTHSNDTSNENVSTDATENDTLSDPQQRGKYLTDDNGIHYYNINNCSEKKGSSGIGDLSECEDAAKEMSEE